MRERKSKVITILVVAITLLALVGAVYLCSYEVSKNLKVEMQNTLKDVAQQNDVAVQKEINARFQLLYSIAQEIGGEPDDVKSLLDSTKTFVDNYRFERIGYIYPIGVAYTTDGYIQDMSYFDFFQNGMDGKITITDAVVDTVGNDAKYINQFSVPVYNESQTEVKGVLFATYQTEWFEDLLNTRAFEGRGYSCIVKMDGDVIAHSTDSPIYGVDNFFSLMDDGKDAGSAEEMRADMVENQSGTGSFSLNGEQDFYYMPLNLEGGELDWYMVTLVSEDVLTDRLRPVMGNIDQMIAIIVLILVCGVSVALWSYQMRRRELIRLAYTDSLTEGDNFACFQKKMQEKNCHGYIIAMDLSEFKIINNTCGLKVGDAALVAVWKVLRGSIRDNELAARIYADRFVLFLAEDEKQKVRERLDKLVEDVSGVSETLNIPRVIPVFGAYEVSGSDNEVEKDYGNAVQAKQLVKGRRDCNYAFYEELDYNQVLENRAIEDGFEPAIKKHQFEVWYQPKYDAMDSHIVGSEALVRWRKEDGSLFAPFKFIPLFERNGMIPRLDEYVFREVCRQQKQWEKEGKKILPVSVNISRVSLYYSNIVEKYKAIADENEVSTENLQLEITESATIDNSEISDLIEQFHQAGFKMLLDDFGTGYSSLSTLNVMHFDVMKLDKSLIDYIGDENGEKLLRYITKLGQNLGLHITAEGVETENQLIFLRDLQCDDIQGYYFSKPLPQAEFEKLL